MSSSHNCCIINLKTEDPNLQMIVTKSQQQPLPGLKSKAYCLLSLLKNSSYFHSQDKALNLLQKILPTSELLAGR